MFQFQQKKPHPSLHGLVHRYLLIEIDAASVPLQFIPDGHPEFFFALGGGESQISTAQRAWAVSPKAALLGQHAEAFSVEMRPRTRGVYVKIAPWLPFALFKIPSVEMIDAALEIDAATRDAAFRTLGQQLLETDDFDRAAAVLDSFFIKKMDVLTSCAPFIPFSIRTIFSSNGTAEIDKLTGQISASRRYVEKVFKQQIGIAPKHFSRIVRVKKATLEMLSPRFSGSLRDVADGLDYYDQSHFLKDFRSIIGQSPREFLRAERPFLPNQLFEKMGQWDYS